MDSNLRRLEPDIPEIPVQRFEDVGGPIVLATGLDLREHAVTLL